MINFQFIDHFDVLNANHKLAEMAPNKWEPVEARGESNTEMIGLGASKLLRAHKDITRENWLDDLPVEDEPALIEWKSMQGLLTRAKAAIMAHPVSQQLLSGEMARAMVSRLDPGSTIFWHVDDGPYHSRTARFHLPLVTNPSCLLYSGHEVAHWEVGTLVYFNNHVRHSAANWGKTRRLHLIFEMYKKARDEG